MTYDELMQQLAASPYGTYLNYNGQQGRLTHDGTALQLGQQSVPVTRGADGSIQFGASYNNDPGFDTKDFIKNAAIAVGGAYGLGTALTNMAAGGTTAALSGSDGGSFFGGGPGGGGPDLVGSDWATGQATGAAGGSLPQTAAGYTAANTAAAPVASKAGPLLGDYGSTIASVAGAVAGSQQPRTVTTTTESSSVPAWAQPYAQDYAKRATEFGTTPSPAYTGPLGAQTTADQNSSYQQYRNIANYNNPLNSASATATMDTINGRYLDPNSNPYLKQTYDLAANRMADAYSRGTAATNNAFFGGSGSFGGSAHQEMTAANNRAFGDSLANLGNQIYGQNYQQERSRQADAAQYAPTMANQQQTYMMTGADALNKAGTQQQNTNLTNNEYAYNEWQRQQNDAYRRLDAQKSAYTGLGGTQTSSAPGTSLAEGLLGGTATGAYIYRMLNGGR